MDISNKLLPNSTCFFLMPKHSNKNPLRILLTGDPLRRIRHPADCRRGMVRQNPARRASRHRHGNGAEGAAQAVRLAARFLPGIPLRTALGRPPEHRDHVRRGLRDGRLLCVHARVCAVG